MEGVFLVQKNSFVISAKMAPHPAKTENRETRGPRIPAKLPWAYLKVKIVVKKKKGQGHVGDVVANARDSGGSWPILDISFYLRSPLSAFIAPC